MIAMNFILQFDSWTESEVCVVPILEAYLDRGFLGPKPVRYLYNPCFNGQGPFAASRQQGNGCTCLIFKHSWLLSACFFAEYSACADMFSMDVNMRVASS